MSTLYNHPGHMTLGLWPSLFANGTAVNGGLPQLGNMSLHLDKVRFDAAALLPPDFDGYAVIDWEEWVPWLEADGSNYYNASLALAGGDEAAAIAAWNISSLDFMVKTLEAAREVRPKGKWGYFGTGGCTFDVTTEACSPEIERINDALQPLWRASTALYPELYASCQAVGKDDHQRCSAANKLPLKLAARLKEARRVAAGLLPAKLPIVAFTWPALYSPPCDDPGNQCPRMTNPSDLDAEFMLAAPGGADAIIVWGGTSDVHHGADDCDKFAAYLNSTLGPVLRKAAGGGGAS